MAEIDDQAFNNMTSVDPDRDISGGAIIYSEYEMDMTPSEQESYQSQNTNLFRNMYNTDPLVDKSKLSFKSYIENLDPELLRMRSKEFDEMDIKKDPEQQKYYSSKIHELKKKKEKLALQRISAQSKAYRNPRTKKAHDLTNPELQAYVDETLADIDSFYGPQFLEIEAAIKKNVLAKNKPITDEKQAPLHAANQIFDHAEKHGGDIESLKRMVLGAQ